MSDADIERRILGLFLEIAPDVESGKLKRAVAFRDQFDFDSMDTLNFAIALHEAFGIEIPETDYRHLSSLASAVAYVQAGLAKRPQRSPPGGGSGALTDGGEPLEKQP